MATNPEAELARVVAALEQTKHAAERWKARAQVAEAARKAERTELARLLTRSLWEITAGATRLAERLDELDRP